MRQHRTTVSRRGSRHALAASVALAGLTLAACSGGEAESADAYPSKPIQMIVPWSAGGDTDAIFRLIADGLSDELGQNVVVQNIAGGGGSVGAQQAMNADSDGYTLLAGHDSIAISSIKGQTDFGYGDFEPIGLASSTYDFVATSAQNDQWTTMEDVVSQVSQDPGSITFAAAIGSTSELQPILIEDRAEIDFNIVGVTDTAERMQQVAGNHIDLGAVSAVAGVEYMEAGTLKLLAYFGPERSEVAPDVPTLQEEGIDVVSATNRGLFAPEGTPEEILDVLSEALGTVAEDESFVSRLAELGTDVNYLPRAEYAEWLTENEAELEQVMANAGMTR